MTIEEIKKIIDQKVHGVWEARHDGTGHRYANTKTGHIQRSVTTKLGILSKPHLTPWAVKMGAEWLMKDNRAMQLLNPNSSQAMIQGMQMAHTDIRDDAGNVGTDAHNMAERWINEFIASGTRPTDIRTFAPPNVDARSIASARAIESWFIKSNAIPVASEILVGHNKYSAGTLDLLYMDSKGKLCLGDFKTSNAVDKIGYSMQIAAYKFFFEHMTGLKIYSCKILHLSKDMDKFDVFKVKDITGALKSFKSVCALHDWIHSPKEKVIKDVKKITI